LGLIGLATTGHFSKEDFVNNVAMRITNTVDKAVE
jgi:hypothetical protein